MNRIENLKALNIQKVLSGHYSEDTAYIVENYPYGFRLRTRVKYWIESNNKGDRFCFQSLNPKSGQWNKPKKSTYTSLEVLYLDNIGHVKSKAVNAGWDNEDILTAFLEGLENYSFNEYQKKQIVRIKAISRTQKYIKVSFADENKPEAQREAEQAEAKKKIGLIYSHELKQAEGEAV